MSLFSSVSSLISNALSSKSVNERNALNVVKQAINPFSQASPITANTSSKTANAILESAANNPYTTAALFAGGGGAVSSVGKSIISKASTTTKLAAGAAGLIGGGFLVGSPESSSTIVKGVSMLTPESLTKYGGAIAGLKKDFSGQNALRVAESNPLITGALAAAGLLVLGKGASGAVNAYTTAENTRQIKESNDLIGKSLTGDYKQAQEVNNIATTNKNDVELAKIAAENNLAIAKQQTEQAKIYAKAQESAAKAAGVSNVPQASPINAQPSSNAIVASPKPKKKAKKKAKSKKKVTKKRKKKASKKKTLKKRSTKRKK